MAAKASDTSIETGNLDLFQKLERYPWDSDEEFQSGLSAILGQNPTLEQAQYLTLKARCFYYSRQGHLLFAAVFESDWRSRKYDTLVDFAAYQSWRSKNLSLHGEPQSGSLQGQPNSGSARTEGVGSSSMGAPEPSPPYPMTFNHIVELITNGEPVPGIKSISDKVLEGQASESTKVRRKKPWETGGYNPDKCTEATDIYSGVYRQQ